MDHIELARMGGKATLKKYGKDHYRKMAELSPKSGRPKKPENEVQPESLKRRESRAKGKK